MLGEGEWVVVEVGVGVIDAEGDDVLVGEVEGVNVALGDGGSAIVAVEVKVATVGLGDAVNSSVGSGDTVPVGVGVEAIVMVALGVEVTAREVGVGEFEAVVCVGLSWVGTGVEVGGMSVDVGVWDGGGSSAAAE